MYTEEMAAKRPAFGMQSKKRRSTVYRFLLIAIV